MAHFFQTLETVLKKDKRFVSIDTGTLLRNKIYETAMNMDSDLIKLLLSNKETKNRFFTDIESVLVFDKIAFGWAVNNHEFLPDSYTRFKNKIELTDNNGDLISASNNVVLSFPYKDCVLEGGQTKEDQKRDEIFYNETLAPDDIDRLLYPKVLVNAKRYTAKGVEENITFKDVDNMIIKGNNLLAISSLLKRFEGKIKCIYIDPPYNTGNDGFRYNDSFNRSTWLTFMKNRLEIAHKLLNREGTIAISIDNYELAYLLILLDEIFGKENRKNIITVKRASASGAKVINPGVVNIVEYVVLYSKDTTIWKPNRVFSAKEIDDRYGNFILNYEQGYEQWSFVTVLDAFAELHECKKSQLRNKLGSDYDTLLETFIIENATKVCQFATLDDNNISQEARNCKRKSIENPDKILYLEREDAKPYFLVNGKVVLFASDRIMNIDGKNTFSQPITDIWDDVLPNDLHNEGGVSLKKGKKPEKLLYRILELCSNKGDLVLDFFAGSGTCGAVAHKSGRQYILIEQMGYIHELPESRIKNVIACDQTGISKSVNWKGGGSFVYCELAECNQKFVNKIESAKTDKEAIAILDDVMETGFISHKVFPKDIKDSAEDFAELSLSDKKRVIMELLDKNMLYVNLCDINDKDYKISKEDKAFTESFYGEK